MASYIDEEIHKMEWKCPHIRRIAEMASIR